MAGVGARNNILAGLFVVGSLTLGVVMAFVLSDRSNLGPTSPYVVRFSVQDGAVGLKPGSDVLLGGQQVGKVEKVTLAEAAGPDGAIAAGIDVAVKLKRDLILYKDAKFSLERPLLGSLTTINIWSIGDASGSAGRLAVGDTIVGGIAPPSILTQAGFTPETLKKIPIIIDDAGQTMQNVREMTAGSRPKIEEAVENVRAITADARGKVGEWSAAGDRIVGNAEGFSQRLAPWMDTADEAVGKARSFAEGLERALSDNRPKIDEMIANARDITDRFKNTTMNRVDEAVAAGREALAEFRTLALNASGIVTEQRPNVEKMLGNARLASDQLKLALVEIRAQPWRLLYRPSAKETAEELLYDSARSYAAAVSDLRAASESLSALVSSPGVTQDAGKLREIDELRTRLREKFERYEKVEQELLDRMIGRGGGG